MFNDAKNKDAKHIPKWYRGEVVDLEGKAKKHGLPLRTGSLIKKIIFYILLKMFGYSLTASGKIKDSKIKDSDP
eukprot:SAG22_NODE_963_length_6279_cov_30.717314_4_plen_74_part_00